MTHAMTSMSGNVAYVKYTAGSNKGQTKKGDVFNDPFALRNPDENYTAEAVVETFATGQTALAWTPCVKGVFQIAVGGTVTTAINADVKVTRGTTVYYGTFADGAEATGTLAGMTFQDATGAAASITLTADDKIAYKYDNVVIPQNDLPILNAEMANIPLLAKARRIAINKYVA